MSSIPAIRRYAAGDRLHVQAQRIWMILIAFISGPTRHDHDPETITYGELALLMGYPTPQAGHMLGRQLGIIGQYCRLNNLPTLNSIVVTQDTGAPGHEVVTRDGYSWQQEQEAVFREPWFSYGVPTAGTLRKVWEAGIG